MSRRQFIQFCTLLCLGTTFASTAVAEKPNAAADRLFDTQRIIDVQITMPEDDWDDVRTPTRSLFEALQGDALKSTFKYRKATIKIDGVEIKNVAIRKKGFLGSLDMERPSLKVRFDKYVDQAPFGDLDRLTLNNNKQDPSRLSQYLSYRLFNESGTVASRCNFAKVSINGRSLGVYSNVESVKPAMLKRRYGDSSGALFEGTVADVWPSSIHRMEPKTDAAKVELLAPLAKLLAEEELDLEKLESLVDIDAFMKFWAMESLIGFWDGYSQNQNNYFVYQQPKNSKLYFMPWGTDSAFTYEIPPPFNKIQYRSMHHNAALANRLCRHPKTRDLYRQTMQQLLDQHWDEEKLVAEIDRVDAMISEHVLDDNAKYKSSTKRVRSFIKGRRSAIEREFKRWPLKVTAGPRQPTSMAAVGEGTASIKTKWFDSSPGEAATQGDGELTLTWNDKKYKFKNAGGYGHPNEDKNVPSVDGRRPPSITIGGTTTDGRQVTLIMGFEASVFRPSKDPVKAFGVIFEGSFAWFVAKLVMNPMGLTFVEATTTFDKASMETGEPIQARMTLKMIKFVGGKSPKVEWQE